jgi:hypothetical protein
VIGSPETLEGAEGDDMPPDIVRDRDLEADARAALENRSLIPLPDVRRILGGIGHNTLYGLIDRHQLTRCVIGRRAFITADSLAAFLDRLAAGDDGAAVIGTGAVMPDAAAAK